MPLSSTALTVAAATSVLASAWAAGLGASFSLSGVPVILSGGGPSELMVRQWRFQFFRGSYIMTTLGALNTLNYWNVAYRCWSLGHEWRGFAAAGALTVFIMPYTLIVIMGTNRKLLAASDPDAKARKRLTDDSARSLIRKWGELNVIRAAVPILGTGLALWNLCL